MNEYTYKVIDMRSTTSDIYVEQINSKAAGYHTVDVKKLQILLNQMASGGYRFIENIGEMLIFEAPVPFDYNILGKD